MGIFSRGKKRLISSRLSIEPPKAALSRSGLAIVSILRNEAENIPDWLAFHALAGVNHAIIYDNLCTDKSLEVLNNFSGFSITIIPWALQAKDTKTGLSLHQQIIAYAHAIETFGAKFSRFAFIDVDEFIVPKGHDSIQDALMSIGSPASLSLPWLMFGHNNQVQRSDIPAPYTYTQRAPLLNETLINFKCIVDPCDVTEVSVHKFTTKTHGRKSINSSGEANSHEKYRKNASFLTTANLQLNHYYLKSKAELEDKLSGPDVSGADRVQRRKVVFAKRDLIERETIRDSSAIDFLVTKGMADAKAFEAYRDGLFG